MFNFPLPIVFISRISWGSSPHSAAASCYLTAQASPYVSPHSLPSPINNWHFLAAMGPSRPHTSPIPERGCHLQQGCFNQSLYVPSSFYTSPPIPQFLSFPSPLPSASLPLLKMTLFLPKAFHSSHSQVPKYGNFLCAGADDTIRDSGSCP